MAESAKLTVMGGEEDGRIYTLSKDTTLTQCSQRGYEMAATYRRRNDGDTWHWCSNRPNWPTSGYTISDPGGPSHGEFCNECRAKQRAGNCS